MGAMPDRPAPRLAALLVLIAGLAACAPTVTPTASTGTGPTPTSSATPSATPATPSPVPTDAGASPVATIPPQTDTDWGRIWDALPAGFPAFASARPTETGTGPASATLDVGATDPMEVATFYQSALEGAGYSTVSMSGPREDGSIEIESAGAGTCRVRTTVTPLGGTTIVTILYGADCPFA